MSVRTAEAEDIDPLAPIWYAGWHEAHAHLVPAKLTGLRTLESFRARLEAANGVFPLEVWRYEKRLTTAP